MAGLVCKKMKMKPLNLMKLSFKQGSLFLLLLIVLNQAASGAAMGLLEKNPVFKLNTLILVLVIICL